uniref:F-box domain-containing protein n=1 Tax=Parascaris univalens TaxID=6257 RepID=A0A914ZVF0_PARUN
MLGGYSLIFRRFFVQTTNSAIAIPSIAKWKRLMNGCLSESVRSELIRLSRNLICLRIAENLKINKVMLADSADQLAECAIHCLVFARGSSVSCLSGAVDRRYS